MALVLENSPAFVVSFLAVTGLGAIAVPLNPQFKQDELEFYFRNSGVRGSDRRRAGDGRGAHRAPGPRRAADSRRALSTS